MAETIEEGWKWASDVYPEKIGKYLCGWKHSDGTFEAIFIMNQWYLKDNKNYLTKVFPYKWKSKLT